MHCTLSQLIQRASVVAVLGLASSISSYTVTTESVKRRQGRKRHHFEFRWMPAVKCVHIDPVLKAIDRPLCVRVCV